MVVVVAAAITVETSCSGRLRDAINTMVAVIMCNNKTVPFILEQMEKDYCNDIYYNIMHTNRD